jgi:hypothetical protein
MTLDTNLLKSLEPINRIPFLEQEDAIRGFHTTVPPVSWELTFILPARIYSREEFSADFLRLL